MLRQEAGIQVDKFYPPTDWQDSNSQQIDIRKNAENNSIVLLVGHSADFSKYSLLGLLAQVSSGTYDVYIDDVLVGSEVTSNTQYDIDFSTIETSYGTATTPEALVLHKVVIKPNTSGATITNFRCARTSGATGTQIQSILWCHFNIENAISINLGFYQANVYSNANLVSVTSLGNLLKLSGAISSSFRGSAFLEYCTILELSNNQAINQAFFSDTKLKRIILQGGKISGGQYTGFEGTFYNTQNIEQINLNKVDTSGNIVLADCFNITRKLKVFPNIKLDKTQRGNNFLVQSSNLFPTKLDYSNDKDSAILGAYGTGTYPMRGLRGLKVSNEAPFSGSSPQIDVSYTGLDRDALRELFTSLPTVTGSQTLKCVGATGVADLTQADKDIATAKGWALTLA